MDCGRPVTQLWLQPRNPLSVCCWLKKISSSGSMATKAILRDGSYARTAGDHQGVVCNQSFLLLGQAPVTSRASRLAPLCPAVWSAAACWLLADNLYTCIHKQHTTHIHVEHTYICIRVRTYIQIYRPCSYPPPFDAPHSDCQLPPQTSRLSNQSRLKLRIFQQPEKTGSGVIYMKTTRFKNNNFNYLINLILRSVS